MDVSNLSSQLSDTSASNYKVCRYTPNINVVNGVNLGDFPPNGNDGHPYNYVTVVSALLNQNFLVISAGDGNIAYGCPPDGGIIPFVNGNTWQHQPHT